MAVPRSAVRRDSQPAARWRPPRWRPQNREPPSRRHCAADPSATPATCCADHARSDRPRNAPRRNRRPRRRVASAPRRCRCRQGTYRTGAAPLRRLPPANSRPPPLPLVPPGRWTRRDVHRDHGNKPILVLAHPYHVAAKAAPVIDGGRATGPQCRLRVSGPIPQPRGQPRSHRDPPIADHPGQRRHHRDSGTDPPRRHSVPPCVLANNE